MKVLLIEDDKLLSSVLRDEFKDESIEVEQAFDGEEGLEKAKANKPDFILLDIMMPKKNGVQVLEILKGDPETKDIPVAVLTVSANEDVLEQTLDLGAVDAMIKSRQTMKGIVERVRSLST